MNTADLLATIAPHREMLKGMGWTVETGTTNTIRINTNGRTQLMYAELAAHILCDVCMEALEKWGEMKASSIYSRTTGGEHVVVFVDSDDAEIKDSARREPTRLAALLALLAWCREVKG